LNKSISLLNGLIHEGCLSAQYSIVFLATVIGVSLLLSNAVTLRRDKSILFSRVAILALLYSSLLAFFSLFLTFLNRGVGLFGGLFHATSTTQIFHLFIFIISAVILQLTAFYPRKV